MNSLTIPITPELLDQIVEPVAQRVAEILKEQGASQEPRWLTGAERIAAYLDCKKSRVYAWKQTGMPIELDGSILCARTDRLDAWRAAGGGR